MRKSALFVLLITVLSQSNGADNVTVQYVPPEPPVPKTTTIPPITTLTPATTVSTTTTTTTTPKTTTTPITTPSTTTSTTTPTTSTTSPTTTVTPKPTPPPPQPKPVDPDIGTWSVNYTATNVTCIVAQLALQIEIMYNTKQNTTSKAYVDLPVNATFDGTCGPMEQSVTLQWLNKTDAVVITFKRTNETSSKYNLTAIQITITPDEKNFPNINDSSVIKLSHENNEFTTSISKSYKCDKLQSLNLTTSQPNITGYIHVSHLHLQAFFNTTGKTFTSAEDCEPFTTSDVVPIAVGCALAALVLIVLVGYLIGRRRSQARGYLSM